MKVIIPAAGAGTRLRPHTHTTPKALVQVAGKPILGHILDRLSVLDVAELILIIGYMGEKIKDYVDSHYNFKTTYVEQKQRLGLGYAINLARDCADGQPVLITLDDTILEVDLKTIVQDACSSIGAKEVDEPKRFGIIELENGFIKRLVEKPENPPTNLAIVGVYYMKVLTFFGTRPEAIKMAPVILELRRYPEDFSVVVVVSAQHRELLDQMLKVFEIEPDYDLDVMTHQQSLSQITTRVLHGIEPILQKEEPDIVLVQGDTTTAFVGALAAFYHKIPVGHVEAGLRTYHKYNPFPEEKNRHLISVLADVHFAPTQRAKENLLQEGIPSHAIHITGNTVVDALLKVICDQKDFHFTDPLLSGLDFEANKILLVTVHRRENLDEPLQSICSALKELVENNEEVRIIFPVHPNPKVYETVHNCLGNIDRIHLIQPLDYISFVHLMSKAYLILTDSGGIQEEAPSLGKPVLVLRQSTERPEGVEAGIIKVVGTNKKDIVETAMVLLNNSDEYSAMVKSTNPYGEGTAASKIARIITTVVDNRRILCL